MSRSQVIVTVSGPVDDEIDLRLEIEGGDLVCQGWITVTRAKELGRKLLGMVEDWERMGGED